MMTALRSNTKPIIWFTAVAFVVGFILILGTDVFFTSGAGPGPIVAKVNGQPILIQAWDQAIQETFQNYRVQTGEEPDPETAIRLRAQTWENMIQDLLVSQEADRMNIEISDEELAFAIRNQPLPEFVNYPDFQTEGRFDLAKYQAALASPGFNTIPLEDFYRRTLPVQKIQEQVLLSARVSQAELWEAYKSLNEKTRFETAHIPLGVVVVSDEDPGDEALAAYLEEHVAEFAIPELADLRFVRFEKTHSAEDSLEAASSVRAALEEYADGEPFDVLVEAYSEAPPSRRGGEQGTFMRREQFSLPALADAAFALAPGGVSDVIAAADGFHIVKVEEKITEDEVEKVKIAEIFVPLRPSYETTVLTRDRVLALADSAAVVGLPAAAGAYGVAPDSTGPFPREGFPRKLGRVQQAVDFAFSAKVGEIGPAMETADAWFILQLVSRTAERSPDLAEVRDRVRLARTQSIRRELALERAARLLESARTAGIAAAAAADSLAKYLEVGPVGRTGFVPGIGSEPKLLGAVFGSDTTAAPQIVASERGAFVFKVLEKIPASRDDFEREKANLRTRILQQRQNEVLTAWLEGLKEKADIEDFRTTLVSL